MSMRAILDTSVIPLHLHKDNERIYLSLIKGSWDQLSGSLPDTAILELLKQLLEGGISWSDWERIDVLNDVLDADMPVVPGGSVLCQMAGLSNEPNFDVADA